MIWAYWYNNKQSESMILQPDFFTPKSQFWLKAELSNIDFPIKINVSATCDNVSVFNKSYVIEEAESDFNFQICDDGKTIVFKDFVTALEDNPSKLDVEVYSGNNMFTKSINCEYATISGTITDFEGNPFPAAVIFNMYAFEGMQSGMGVWSDVEGNYSISLPKGEYNSIFVDDDSYGKSSLESWCWKMVIDHDEVHDFKIGNAEVYSLNVWANNGGFSTLFIAFRPMVLSYCLEPTTHDVKVNGKDYSLMNSCPDIDINSILVRINGCKVDNVSLQKLIETGQDGSAMPLYILQVKRLVSAGKQTLAIEYDFADSKGERIQGQGRTQFYYASPYGLAVR